MKLTIPKTPATYNWSSLISLAKRSSLSECLGFHGFVGHIHFTRKNANQKDAHRSWWKPPVQQGCSPSEARDDCCSTSIPSLRPQQGGVLSAAAGEWLGTWIEDFSVKDLGRQKYPKCLKDSRLWGCRSWKIHLNSELRKLLCFCLFRGVFFSIHTVSFFAALSPKLAPSQRVDHQCFKVQWPISDVFKTKELTSRATSFDPISRAPQNERHFN